MLNHPDIIPFFWLFLVAILVVPMTSGTLLEIYKAVTATSTIQRFFSKGSTTLIDIAGQQSKLEQRKEPRIFIDSLEVNITDGRILSTAWMTNISKRGVCLEQVPTSLYLKQDCLTIYSNKHKTLPTIHIHPKWQTKDLRDKTIGGVLMATSKEWVSFLEEYSPPAAVGVV